MEISEYLSSGYFIILFFVLLAGIFVALYIFRRFIPLIFPGKINGYRFKRYFAIGEGIIYALFLLAAAFFFLKNNIVFSAALFLVLLILLYWYSRFVLRDYIAGLIFKAENRFSIGEIIEVEGKKGIIRKLHYRNAEIETEDGKMIFLPNSMLLSVISSPQNISETILNYNFELYVPNKQPYDKAVDQLKKYILTLPWTVLKNEPKFQLIKETDQYYVVKITLFSFDEGYFQSMRSRVQDFVKQNF